MSNLIKTDKEYSKWIQSISRRYRSSQIKAAVRVNDEMLRFYWSLGRDIVDMKAESKWGSGFYENLSKDLQDAIPDTKGFSPSNLNYMKRVYELFKPLENGHPQAEGVFHHQLDGELDLANIFRIPWGHLKLLADKCKGDTWKALFFVKETIESNWSRTVLLNYLDTDLYERQGKAITNFSATLPEAESDLAQTITKDPYNFDFLTIRERYDEKELKDALTDKVHSFLMELGTGFAFIGREVRLEVGNTEKLLDMLFYNTRQHCYVVVEIKAVDFDSSFAGQLGTYVVAVNHQIKTDEDNPTIGLLICKGMDKVEVQYALESASQPLGVSSYELSKLIPEKFKGSLPTIEEIEAEISDNI